MASYVEPCPDPGITRHHYCMYSVVVKSFASGAEVSLRRGVRALVVAKVGATPISWHCSGTNSDSPSAKSNGVRFVSVSINSIEIQMLAASFASYGNSAEPASLSTLCLCWCSGTSLLISIFHTPSLSLVSLWKGVRGLMIQSVISVTIEEG